VKKKISVLLAAFFVLAAMFTGCTMEKSSVTLGNVLILGDSYSTFEGKIPEGYSAYYSKKSKKFGVDSYRKTWWHILMERTDSKLLLNSSYSGTTLCHTGYDGADYSEISFAARLDNLIASGFFENNVVDTLVILGGLNDYWASSPRGEIKHDGFTKEDLYSVYPAFAYILSRVNETSPETRIIYIAEEYLPDDMKADMREICTHYGAETMEIHEISKIDGHPDKDGMKAIAEQAVEYLENKK
jgi:hypothetical protein